MTKAPVRFEAKDFYAFGIKDSALNTVADLVNARLADYFKDAVEVFGYKDVWNHFKDDLSTHRAYLVGIEPISRGVTKDEIIEVLSNPTRNAEQSQKQFDLARRIATEGIK